MTTHIVVRDGPRGPVTKPTGFMTSSQTVCEELSTRCRDTHVHVTFVGGRASACQEYFPPPMCSNVQGYCETKGVQNFGIDHDGVMQQEAICVAYDQGGRPGARKEDQDS